MADNLFNNDLFGDQVPGKDAKGNQTRKVYPGHRFLPHVRVPIEYMVIVLVAFLLLLVVAYAIGVERGKKIERGVMGSVVRVQGAEIIAKSEKEKEKTKKEEVEKKKEKVDREEAEEERVAGEVTEKLEKVILAENKNEEEQAVIESGSPQLKKTPKDVEGDLDRPVQDKKYLYSIRLAAYAEKLRAESEVESLKETGCNAGYEKSGRWYQVYVTGFQTIEETQAAKKTLVGRYPDCYIRKNK